MRRLALSAVVASAAACLLTPVASAARRPPQPYIHWVTCWPRTCGIAAPRTAAGSRVLIAASRLRGRLYAEFPVRGRGRRTRLVRAYARAANRLLARVPGDAVSGRIRIRARGGRPSNYSRILRVVRPPAGRAPGPLPAGTGTAFDGNGMWIWVLSRSEGGDLNAIVSRARASRISTIFLKSSDGTSFWSQFTASNVQRLKSAGLRVCAWQYVYGANPSGEAAAGVRAAQTGADCLVIDAESEYEGRYAQAQTYVRALRAGVGPSYPVGLTGFPYVDFHPAFPYSVFLGPGAAQFNLPQMYWRAIGTSVDGVYSHTWPLNRPYQRPILPLGQTYEDPPPSELARFRQLAGAYGASGLSWWDWQETTARGWSALAAPVAGFGSPPSEASAWPRLASGSRGDLVVWAQEHLRGAGQSVAVDGAYGSGTAQAVRSFQSSHGLPVTGAVDAATWPALLRAPAAEPNWAASASSSGTGAARASGARTGPASATLPARRYEIPRSGGRGG